MLFELRAQTVSPRAAAPFFRSNKFARGAERVDIFTKSSPERARAPRRPGLGLEIEVWKPLTFRLRPHFRHARAEGDRSGGISPPWRPPS